MKMRMPVPIRGRKPQRQEPLELRLDLLFERIAETAVERIPQARPGRTGNKIAPRVGERRHGGPLCVAEREVQAHGQPGVAPGDADRSLQRVSVDHEAGLRQQTLPVEALYFGIDLRADSEIIAGHDQTFHDASSYSGFLSRRGCPGYGSIRVHRLARRPKAGRSRGQSPRAGPARHGKKEPGPGSLSLS